VDILTFNNVIVLEEADILKMETPTGNKIEMTASVLEISRN
jgi:ribosomal protein L21